MPVRILNTPQGRQTKEQMLRDNQKVRPQKNQLLHIASTNREMKQLCTNQNQNQIDQGSEKEPEGQNRNSQPGWKLQLLTEVHLKRQIQGRRWVTCASPSPLLVKGKQTQGDFRKGFVKKTVREFSDSRRIGSQNKKNSSYLRYKYPRSINATELIAWSWEWNSNFLM